jgi:translocation and assembly module TamB
MPPVIKAKTRWLLVLTALAILIVSAGAVWLLATEAGLARAVVMLESLDNVKIRVTGARGRLIGPLSADAIVIEHRNASIRITGFDADYEPSEILAGRISAERAHAATIAIQMHAHDKKPGPPSFMPRWLTLAIDDVAVSELTITSPHGADLRLHAVSGSAKITRSQIRFEDAAADAGSWAVAGASGRVLARDPVAIEADAAWSLMAERELTGAARASGDLDRLLVKAQISTPGKGSADVELTKLTGELRWVGKAEIASLDLGQWIDPAPFGPLRATFDGRGNISHYAFTGLIQGEELPASGVTLAGAADYADGLINIPELRLAEPGGATVRMQGTMTATGQPAFDMNAEWTDFSWPLVGSAVVRSSTGTLQAQGWREFNYRLAGKFQPLDAPPAEGWAAGRFTATQLIVEESSLQVLGGRIEAKGMLARDEHRAWTISGRAQDIDPATLRKDLPGRLSFAYAASGSGLDEDARWAAAVSGLSGQFRGQVVGGGGTVRRQGALTQFERVALAIGPARLQLEGSLGPQSMLDAKLVANDLSGFLPELGGRIDATLRVRGSSVDIAFKGHDLAWEEHQAAVLSADAKIDLKDRQTSWLRLRSAGLRIAGQALTETRLSLDGFTRDHRVEFRVGAGEDAVELLGRGSYLDQRYTLETQSIVAAGPRAPPYQLEAPTRLLASFDHVELAPACFVYETRRICAEGRWQRNTGWSLQAATQSFPLEAKNFGVSGRPRFHGKLFVEARASGVAGQPWLAEVQAEIREALFQYESASGKEQSIALGRTIMTLQSDPERHRLNLRLVDAVAADLTAELVAERSAGVPFSELPVTGSVRGATRELGLLPLMFEDIDHASGSLVLDLAVSGRLAAPRLQGEVRLADGTLDFYQANLRLRDIQATLALQETGLDLRATATAGGGSLSVDGRLGWQERHLNGVLTMKGERLLLVDVPEARVLASPDLRFALADRHIDVTGSVTIPAARIVPAATADAVLVSTDERILQPQQEADETPPFEVTSDLRLTLGDKVNIDAYGLSGRITGTVRARSVPREPAVASGQLEIEDGTYSAYTRKLDVERGRLLFTGGPVTDPGVDLRASRELPDHVVGVIVRGRLRKPELTLYSEPPLPQSQIASMLIVGRTLDSLQDKDESNALVLGRYLSPRLYVSYGISLVDEINTLKMRYTVGDRWVLAVESGLASAIDIEYHIER